MKVELKRVPKLKLRTVSDQTLVDLQTRMRTTVRKRSFFGYFIGYRIIAGVTTPLIIGTYLFIKQYLETGEWALSINIPGLFLPGIAASLIMILAFHLQTRSLRIIIDAVVDGREYSKEQAMDAYAKSFALPVRFTVGELIAAILLFLTPLFTLEITGFLPFNVGIHEIFMAWWLGTMTLLLSSFLFLQNWVEQIMMRLYDYGLRISPHELVKKKSNIYTRIISINSVIIITLILLYANILLDISAHLAGGLIHRYAVQFVFVSLIIVLGTAFFLLMILGSIKKSFDILQNKMQSIQDGDYSIRILNFRDDEIGELYEHFDFMVSTINNVLGTLEDEIGKRTSRLEDINAKLAKYLSPQLYSKIYQDDAEATLSYARKKLTIFFSDIVGFTHISENLAPEDLSRILNQYLEVMAGIALKWGGTIDKYIGDAILVFFGDPEFTNDKDHAVRCVRMALEMLGELAALRGEWARSGIPYPLHVRIGINTGFCTVGNFGSENRMDYTVIGNAVNLASRLQTAAPADGILISETTHLLVNDMFRCAAAGLMKLKGIDQPVKAYRIEESIARQGLPETTELHVDGFDMRIDPATINDDSRDLIKKVLNDAYRLISNPGKEAGE